MPESQAHARVRLQKCQEDISALSMQLSGLVGEILSLPGDTSSLMGSVDSVKRDLSNLDLAVRKLLLDCEETISLLKPSNNQ